MFNNHIDILEKLMTEIDAITAQKMKFSIKDFFSKFDQTRRKLRIWSYLPKKSLMRNFIFCTVHIDKTRSYFG